MSEFPEWTGPEAVRRLNAKESGHYYQWPDNRNASVVLAMQQLMVDAGLPEPVDEVAQLLRDIQACCERYGDHPPRETNQIMLLIREALAKARGERT